MHTNFSLQLGNRKIPGENQRKQKPGPAPQARDDGQLTPKQN